MNPESLLPKNEVCDLYQAIIEHFPMYCSLFPVYLFVMNVITFRLSASSFGNKLKHILSVLDVKKGQ